MSQQDVEFRTLDGLTLRGWLYPAAQRGPALIMTQGVRISDCNIQNSNGLLTVLLTV